jgi:hypothetical protein
MNENERIQRIPALTYDQRISAQDKARQMIAGKSPVLAEPRIEDFDKQHRPRFAPEMMKNITRFADLIMIAAFIPSAFRIFVAGFESSQDVGFALVPAGLVAVCSVMLAELGMIGFTLAIAVTEGKFAKGALYIAALMCVVFAFVGNYHTVIQYALDNDKTLHAFTWLEAFAPPALALIAATVRKGQLLHANEARAAAQQSYQQAVDRARADYALSSANHSKMYEDAKLSAGWVKAYANAIRELVWALNKQSSVKRGLMESFSADDWVQVVQREMQADDWMPAPVNHIAGINKMVTAPAPQPSLPLRTSVRATGSVERTETGQGAFLVSDADEDTKPVGIRAKASVRPVARSVAHVSGNPKTGATIGGATYSQERGGWIAVCPQCGKPANKLDPVYDSERSALAALSNHTGRRCEMKTVKA